MYYVLSFCVLLITAGAVNACEIRHPGKQDNVDARHEYPKQLLMEILSVTDAQYGECVLVDAGNISQKRQISWLQSQNERLDVAWLPANQNTNEKLRAIPYPIRKGLLGWRVLLIHRDHITNFASVDSLADLQPFSAGFGNDWGDLPVMQHNFVKVVTSTRYESLFEMLNFKRFDFLSRSVYEAFDETILRQDSHPDIVMEQNIALRYPQVDFFYVSKENTELAARITSGINQLNRSGRFNTLFYGFYADYIRRVNMATRKVIEIENPFLPNNVPFNDPELWFQLNEVGKYTSD
jgi:hypothetical protein